MAVDRVLVGERRAVVGPSGIPTAATLTMLRATPQSRSAARSLRQWTLLATVPDDPVAATPRGRAAIARATSQFTPGVNSGRTAADASVDAADASVDGASERGTATLAAARRPFVFLDKDGTLVDDVPYNVDPALIRLAPDAGPALRTLAAAGYRLAIVSNQSGVARGLFPEEALGPYFSRLSDLLAAEAVELDAILYCPHHRDGVNEYAIECQCRKPAPGLLLRAAGDLGADLAASWIVGDILDDVEAGHGAGTRAVLLDAGHETEWRAGRWRRPEIVATSLTDAAERILAATPAAPSPEPTTTGARQ